MSNKLSKQLSDELRAFIAAGIPPSDPVEQDKIAERLVTLLLSSRDSVQQRKTADEKYKAAGKRP